MLKLHVIKAWTECLKKNVSDDICMSNTFANQFPRFLQDQCVPSSNNLITLFLATSNASSTPSVLKAVMSNYQSQTGHGSQNSPLPISTYPLKGEGRITFQNKIYYALFSTRIPCICHC